MKLTIRLALAAGILTSTALADGFRFTQADACPGCVSQATGINNQGTIAGTWFDGGGAPHGYILGGRSAESFDVPGALATFGLRISENGSVSGFYIAPSGDGKAFVRHANGTFTTLPSPAGAHFVAAADLTNSGTLVGAFTADPSASVGFQAFLYDGSYRLIFSYPGANVVNTFANCLSNSGVICGSVLFQDGTEHGFLRMPNGSFQQVDVPNAVSTEVFRVTDAGTMAGRYQDTFGTQHGFIWTKDGITTVDANLPFGYLGTYIYDINPAGSIAGYMFPSDPNAGPWHAFIGQPQHGH